MFNMLRDNTKNLYKILFLNLYRHRLTVMYNVYKIHLKLKYSILLR